MTGRLGKYAENSVVCGHVLDVLRQMPDECVHMICTSPPYWGLRSYDTPDQVWDEGDEACEHVWGEERSIASTPHSGLRLAAEKADGRPRQHNVGDEGAYAFKASQGQFCSLCGCWKGSLGLEPDPSSYIRHLVTIFREVKRVLRGDGTCWVVIGDSYASGKGTCFNPGGGDSSLGQARKEARVHPLDRGSVATLRKSGLKPKDQVLIPFRLALALQADGWFVRSTIIWAKGLSFARHKVECPHCQNKFEAQYSGSCMPESTKDRPTQSYEYVFLLTKSKSYYYDQTAVREPGSLTSHGGGREHDGRYSVQSGRMDSGPVGGNARPAIEGGGRNLRSVWAVNPRGWAEAHFATYPEALIEPCILAGTSARGVCPECGGPWERVVEKTGHVNKREPAHCPNNSPTKVDSTGWAPTTRATDQWRPTCMHYDGRYRSEFPKAKSARKRWQRDLSGNWWKRVRKRPGKGHWSVVPPVVLDPFAGAGTTPLVALQHRRNFFGIELNEDYCEMAEKRIRLVQPRLL